MEELGRAVRETPVSVMDSDLDSPMRPLRDAT